MSKIVKTVIVVAIAVAVVVFAPQIAAVLASVAGSLGVTVAATAISSALIGMGISMALTAAATLFRKAPSMSQSMVDRLNTSVVPTASRKIIFGTTAGGADVRFFEGDLDLPSTKKDGYVQVVALASHRINALKQFYVENDLVWQNGAFVSKRNGFAPNNPFRVVTEGKPGNGFSVGSGRYWNSSSTFTGCAYYVPFWKLDTDVWESGIPQRLTAIVEGCPLYDPRRDSTRGGSGAHRVNDPNTYAFRDGSIEIGRNPALALLTYLLGWRINGKVVWGMGIPANRIDFDNFRTYANLCEEGVAVQGGGTVQRYTADGIFSTTDSHETVINGLTAAMGSCKLTDRGGTYCIVGGYDDTAGPKVAFDADDLVAPANGSSPYIWNPAPASRERFNIVRGRFANPEELYQLTDWGDPIEREALADGIPRTMSVDLGAVSRAETCQRIAKQMLLREYLCPGTFAATFGPKAFAVEIGSVITLSLPAEGWNNKLFRVMEQAESHDLFFQMTLREEDPAIYAWDREEKSLPATIRPQGYDASTTIVPANLALTSASYSGANGVNVSEVHVTWTPELSGRVNGIQIQSRPAGTDAWSEQAALFDPKIGTFTFTSNAPGITVEVRARFRMMSAVYSPWVSASVATAEVITITDWENVTDTGGTRPADNATVGAQVGTNLKGENGNNLGRDDVLNAAGAFAANLTYTFDDNTFADFSVVGATLAAANGILTLTSTTNDPNLGLTVSKPGKDVSVIRMRMRPKADDQSWQGQVYYANGAHAESEAFTKIIADPGFRKDEWQIVEWDMNTLTAGGTDYIDGTTARVRWDFATATGQVWEIDWVQLGARVNGTLGAPVGTNVGNIPVSDLVSKVGILDSAGFTDNTPPNTPTGLALSSVLSDVGVTLTATWTAPSNSDLAGYYISLVEGSTSLGEFTTTSAQYSWQALKRNQAYSVKVGAYDKAGNRSAYSATITVSTVRDTVPPAPVASISAVTTYENAFVKWTNPADADLAGSKIEIYRAGSLVNTINIAATPNSVGTATLTSLTKASTYYVRITAYDTSGNASAAVQSSNFTTAGGIGAADFLPGLSPVQTVTALPAISGYTGSPLVLFNGEVYRLTNSAWTKELQGSDIKANTLNGSQIIAGTIQTAQLAAGAIVANKLAIGNTDNVFPDAGFRDPTFWGTGANGFSFIPTNASWKAANTNLLAIDRSNATLTTTFSPMFEVEPNATYRIRTYYFAANGFSGWMNLALHMPGVRWHSLISNAGFDPTVNNNNGNTLRTATGGVLLTESTVIMGDIYENKTVQFRFDCAFTGQVQLFISMVRVGDTTLIGNGAVTTDKITVGTLNGDRITTNTLNANKITAGSVLADSVIVGGQALATTTAVASNSASNTWYPTGDNLYDIAGNKITKKNSNAWDQNCYTREVYIGGCTVTGSLASDNTFIGLSDGREAGNYGYLDYAWHRSGDGNTYMFENGANVGAIGATGGTGAGIVPFSIVYDGRTVRYYRSEALHREVVVAAGRQFAGGVGIAVPGCYVDRLAFTPSADNSLSRSDPADRINNFTTTVSGGKITTGSIQAAQIAAGSITTDKLTIAARGISLEGITFEVKVLSGSQELTWTAGNIAFRNGNGVGDIRSIASGSTYGIPKTCFVYWIEGENVIRAHPVAQDIWASPNHILLGTYMGGVDFNMTYGSTVINGNRITTGSITADRIGVNSLSAISANIGTVTAGMVRSSSGGAYFDLDNARIVFNNGSVMKVQGVGFGSSNQFIEWFGPVQSAFTNCTEANATYYLKTNGSAYFGGSLSAGVLKNSVQTTSTAQDANVTTGTFGSNGKTRVVTIGYSATASTRITGGCPAAYTPYATIRLFRGTTAGGTLLAEQQINGSHGCVPGAGQYEPGNMDDSIGGSFTYTDNTGGSTSSYYVQIVARSIMGTNLQQNLGVTSVEQ